MALLDPDTEISRARHLTPFANGFEGDSWAALWCDDCTHYLNCPLILVAILGRTPAAWEDRNPGALNRYTCHEFEAHHGEKTPMRQQTAP